MKELDEENVVNPSFFGKSSLLGPTIEALKPSVDLVLPVHNEVESVQSVVSSFYYEISTKMPSRTIVAEDGSTDGTKGKLSELREKIPILLISSQQRKGYAKGVRDALKKCTAPWIFFSDSDGQYSPSDFWQLWKSRHGLDMIIGRKICRREGIHRTVLSNGFHGMANTLFKLSLRDADCGFRLIRRNVVDAIAPSVKILEYSFWMEFTIRSCLAGFKILEVPINHSNRLQGTSQIYKTSKLPLIVLKQMKGLAMLYSESRNGC